MLDLMLIRGGVELSGEEREGEGARYMEENVTTLKWGRSGVTANRRNR